jgi:HD superfamily phosphohydrolase
MQQNLELPLSNDQFKTEAVDAQTVNVSPRLPVKAGTLPPPLSLQHDRDFLQIGSSIYGGQCQILLDLLPYMAVPEFQRLEDVCQLGCAHYVFPDAKYNRKMHSLGVCHLATDAMLRLAKAQPELNIAFRDVFLVAFAALYHDSGHLMGSHNDLLYLSAIHQEALLAESCINAGGNNSTHNDNNNNDNDSPNDITTTNNSSNNAAATASLEQFYNGLVEHEERGVALIRFCSKKYQWAFTEQELSFIDGAIRGEWKSDLPYPKYMYQIINNRVSGIDVDRIDYEHRDLRALGLSASYHYDLILDNIRVHPQTLDIWFNIKAKDMLRKIGEDRYTLHQQLYQHATIKKYDCMYKDIMLEISKVLDIPKMIRDPECSWTRLTDGLLYQVQHGNQFSEKARELLLRMQTHTNLYKLDKDKYYNHGFEVRKQVELELFQSSSGSSRPSSQSVSPVRLETKTTGSSNGGVECPSNHGFEAADKTTVAKEDDESGDIDHTDLITANIGFFSGKENFFPKMNFYRNDKNKRRYKWLGPQRWPSTPAQYVQSYTVDRTFTSN